VGYVEKSIRHSGLENHVLKVKEANTMGLTIYDLLERAIEETRQLWFII
jgi:hypothetical protein